MGGAGRERAAIYAAGTVPRRVTVIEIGTGCESWDDAAGQCDHGPEWMRHAPRVRISDLRKNMRTYMKRDRLAAWKLIEDGE